MQVVHVVRQFHPAIGGMENVVRELALAQVAAGHSVRVVTLNRLFRSANRNTLSSRDTIDGIEVVRIPFFGPSRYPIATSVIRFVGDADIVHVHGIDFFFDFLGWTKLWHRRKLVVSTHGGFFHTPYAAALKRMYFATVTRLSLTWYDGVAAISDSDYALFARIRKHGMVCIENGANVAKYGNASAPVPVKTIAWIGRFSVNKRLDRLVNFVAAVRGLDNDWRLKIAGQPWELDTADVDGLARNAGIIDATEIVVNPSEANLRKLLGGCSVLASSSDFEGFGIVAVEGLSAGLFPLLSDIPSFRHLIRQTGLGMLADFDHPKRAATEFLARWREVSLEYARVRRAAVAAAAEFDWRHASRAYTNLYDAVRGTRTRCILDVPVPVRTRLDAVEQLDSNFEKQINTIVAFANANCLNFAYIDDRVRIALQGAMVLNDGVGIDLASKLLFGTQFPENLNGTDFTPHYLQRTRHQFRIYLLGGRRDVAQRAAHFLSSLCRRHLIVGCCDGYFPRSRDAVVTQAIRASRADIVLVAMGNPEQELWLRSNLAATGCRLGIAVGGLFDFLAGDSRRAPQWVRAARLEWVYRLAREPQRLWRRYVLGNPIFMLRVLGQWWSGARV